MNTTTESTVIDQSSSYHRGEISIQERTKTTKIAKQNAKMIKPRISPAAINFIDEQQMVTVTSLTDEGQVWVSVLIGVKGFIQANTATQLTIDRNCLISATSDLLWQNITNNASNQCVVGLVILELSTRRRLRVNGRVTACDDVTVIIDVDAAYPNCIRYIQRRVLTLDDDLSQMKLSQQQLPPATSGKPLSESQIALISQADSMFVGSAVVSDGKEMLSSCDASYRGGTAGFIKVKDALTLQIPDYPGNNMFNTLGNIELYPFAGLVFIDFEHHVMLQLSGRAEILWDVKDKENATAGTRRMWLLKIEQWQQNLLPQAMSWDGLEASIFNP